MKYKPTIGLEIHAELNTQTKMFCDSKNDPHETRPNVNICPVCMAHPGTLPVINKEAVKHILKIGHAIKGTLAEIAYFDRKNYFYPDLPKGYQISQYKNPLVSGGSIQGVLIERVHLEEDTGRSAHDVGDFSLVDFNRAGVPLMELVTKPVITSAEQAVSFAKELQLLLRCLGVGEARMEKGEMRVEANISVSDTEMFGTKVEVKNLNSFKAVEKAIAYEIKRQSEALEKGEKIVQETRGWDENNNKTFSQRLKEESHDYRYFPDPDLPAFMIPKEFKEITLPELPWEKRDRLKNMAFLQDQDIELLLGDTEFSKLFVEIEKILVTPSLVKIAANFILNDIIGQKKKDSTWLLPNATFLAEVVRKYEQGTIASPQAKRALITGEMVATIDSSALPVLVEKIIDAHPHIVKDYKAGKDASLQFLIGQGMKETKGSANPSVLKDLFITILNK